MPLAAGAQAVGAGTNVSGGSQNAGTSVAPVPAQGTDVKLINPLKGKDLKGFLNDILDFVIDIGTIVVILMIVFVGFKFVAAQGNESELSAAKKMLLWTIIGALVLLGAKAISVSLQATVRALGG